MKKICERCGKVKEMMSWDSLCYQCLIDADLEIKQQQIRTGEDDVDTYSSDYIICPYCGNAYDNKYCYEDFPEIYQEGDHEIDCDECGKTFILETMVSYSYETRKE